MKKNRKEEDEEIRRAKAEAAALSHMTPTILPGELLFGNKTRNFRGAFCGRAYERRHILSGYGHLGDTGYRHIKQADIKLT